MRLLVRYVARVCIIHNTGRAILGLERRGSHVVEAYDFDFMYVDATHTQLKFPLVLLRNLKHGVLRAKW